MGKTGWSNLYRSDTGSFYDYLSKRNKRSCFPFSGSIRKDFPIIRSFPALPRRNFSSLRVIYRRRRRNHRTRNRTRCPYQSESIYRNRSRSQLFLSVRRDYPSGIRRRERLFTCRNEKCSLSRGGYRCSRFIRLRKYLFIFHSRSRYHVRPPRRQSTRRFKYSLSISGRKQDCTLIANRNRILRYPPVNLHTQAKFVRTKYSAHRTEEAVCKLQTASSHHPRHSIDLGPIGSSSIRSLFSGHSRANPFGPDFERYKTLQKHRLDREADYASFPSSAATDCASSERIRTCTRSSETILLRSWIATAADCVSFSGLFFRIRSINC